MTSHVLLSAALIFALGTIAADAAGVLHSVDPALIANYVVVRPGLAFSGKLRRSDRHLRYGIQDGLNLRTEARKAPRTMKQRAGAGLRERLGTGAGGYGFRSTT